MRGLLLLHTATLAQLAPVVAGLAAGRLESRFRRAAALWCLLLFLGDFLALMVSAGGAESNLWISYYVSPVGTAFALWALSLIHPDTYARRSIRWAIPLVVTVGAILTLTVEEHTTFSLVVGPVYHVALLLAAAWTFVRLGTSETDSLVRQDWFWIVGGIMIYTATLTALQPVSWFLQATEHIGLLAAAYYAKAVADVVAFLAVAGGILCPVPPRPSGGSLSPAFSRSGC